MFHLSAKSDASRAASRQSKRNAVQEATTPFPRVFRIRNVHSLQGKDTLKEEALPMSWVWSGLVPHAPVLVEAVSRSRREWVAKTVTSLQALAENALAQGPDRVVVVTPHAPRPARGHIIHRGPVLGNFSAFGAETAALSLPADPRFTDAYLSLDNRTLALEQSIDHGAAVPLMFLVQAGWRGPTVVLGLPWGEGPILEHMGDQLAACEKACGGRSALFASGDMSHCLSPGAPSGHHPAGAAFDGLFCQLLQNGDFEGVCALPGSLQEEACQDVVGSCRVVWQATGYRRDLHAFSSYEAPFGVGYCVMRFHQEAP
jgi:aromatic ring-opening dioxygenase LigB subunit